MCIRDRDIRLLATFEKDTTESREEGLLEIYKRLRPGEPLNVENAESLIMNMFFDPRRYDLAKVGRYKFNKKLAISARIKGRTLAEPVADPRTGEIIANEDVYKRQGKGQVNDTVPVELDGDNLLIGFNCRFLLDALSACDEEKVKMEFSAPTSGCFIKSVEGDDSYIYMILPVRLYN